MLPKHYRSNGFKIFLIKNVNSPNGTKINPTFSFYSCPVFTFNDDSYLCFYTKMPLLVDDVIPLLKSECKLHVDSSQVLATNFDESFGIKRTRAYRKRKKLLEQSKKQVPKSGCKYILDMAELDEPEESTNENDEDDEHSLVCFYIWKISDSLFDDFSKLVYGLGANRIKAEFNSFYCKITCEERMWHSLIPLFRLFDVEIAFNLTEIPAVYIEDVSSTISDENVSKFFTKRAGGDCGIIKIRLDKSLSGGHIGERVFSIEFVDMDKCNYFVQEYQDYDIQGSLLNIKRMIDDDVFEDAKRAEITMKGLELKSLSPQDRKEIRSDLEERYGEIYHLRVYYENQNNDGNEDDDGEKKVSLNVIFCDVKNGLRAIYDTNYGEVEFTRSKIWLFNLLPETTEQEVIDYFPDGAKPISVEIYPQEKTRCWWATLQFNKKNLKDVINAEEFLQRDDREGLGLLIPFGYIPYYGGSYLKKKPFTTMCVNYLKRNSIFIENTQDVTIDQIVFLLESNDLMDVVFLYIFDVEKKIVQPQEEEVVVEKKTKAKKKGHAKKAKKVVAPKPVPESNDDFEITVVSFRDVQTKQKAIRALENESIEGKDIEVKEIEKAAMKKKFWFPKKKITLKE